VVFWLTKGSTENYSLPVFRNGVVGESHFHRRMFISFQTKDVLEFCTGLTETHSKGGLKEASLQPHCYHRAAMSTVFFHIPDMTSYVTSFVLVLPPTGLAEAPAYAVQPPQSWAAGRPPSPDM
jgi:hypothetical protein